MTKLSFEMSLSSHYFILSTSEWCVTCTTSAWAGLGKVSSKIWGSEAPIKFSIMSGAKGTELWRNWLFKSFLILKVTWILGSPAVRAITAWAAEANHTGGFQSILGPCTCQHDSLPWTDLWASEAAMLSQQHMAVPRCQPVLLLQGHAFLPLSALLYNLLYVLEQLHSTPHLLIATPGSAVSLFSPVLGKLWSWHLSWGVAHSSW